jgi:hypothetical protein
MEDSFVTRVATTTARIGDIERDACIDQLTTELVQGRITEEEFREKSQAALEARTRGDLDALTESPDVTASNSTRGQALSPSSAAPAALTLSTADLIKGGGYVVVSAVVCFIALGWLVPDVFSQLLLWLFSLTSAGIGALLARRRPV